MPRIVYVNNREDLKKIGRKGQLYIKLKRVEIYWVLKEKKWLRTFDTHRAS